MREIISCDVTATNARVVFIFPTPDEARKEEAGKPTDPDRLDIVIRDRLADDEKEALRSGAYTLKEENISLWPGVTVETLRLESRRRFEHAVEVFAAGWKIRAAFIGLDLSAKS